MHIHKIKFTVHTQKYDNFTVCSHAYLQTTFYTNVQAKISEWLDRLHAIIKQTTDSDLSRLWCTSSSKAT